jgi:starch synthase (maltosyl-transferring)
MSRPPWSPPGKPGVRVKGSARRAVRSAALSLPPPRVVIERVSPAVDDGRFPVRRIVGDTVVVEADVFADGQEVLACVLLYRREQEAAWTEVPLSPLANDRWRGEFVVTHLGRYRYTLQAWVDRPASWQRDLAKKIEAGQDVAVELLVGAELLAEAGERASGAEARQLSSWSLTLRSETDPTRRTALALEERLLRLSRRFPDRRRATTCDREWAVVVERQRARFSAWYELFPRSTSPQPGAHGTFKDVEARLAYVAKLGFDVLYLPPIHPIGREHRKGKNNALLAGPEDPGCPWAIGSREGGHTAIHPQLGTLRDFKRLVAKAQAMGIEVALDLAFQCAPDHPDVQQHPGWFRWRPDGTVQYAENPPKKYEDIFPFDFDTSYWRTLWRRLKGVVDYWIDQGVRIFRVDNPHTKPLAFWEWLIGETTRRHPDVLFLSEAFTRPRIMYRLAKLGFTQSYTYFAWRNTKWELTEYFTELTQTPVREYFRPHLWPNTPDILTEYLQAGGRPAFMIRLILAATLGANYGIYGPAFELCERRPREPRSEEYLNAEQYELKSWELDRPDSLAPLLARLNWIRRDNPALQQDWRLRFHTVANEQLLCYSKRTADAGNVILVVVNLDPHHRQAGWVELDLDALEVEPRQPYQVHDLLSDARFLWHGAHNYVELDPQALPAHVFRIRKRIRTEHDFEYYL